MKKSLHLVSFHLKKWSRNGFTEFGKYGICGKATAIEFGNGFEESRKYESLLG